MKGFRKLALLFLGCLAFGRVSALEPPQWWQDLHGYDPARSWYQYMTYTAAHFGPNALPVPEQYDGRIPVNHQAEVSTDVFWGYGDATQSLSTRLVYAALPGRLSLNAWGVLAEHYRTTDAVRDFRASQELHPDETMLIGDFYLSAALALLQEKRLQPDLLLDVVLKTSSSKTASSARYFDTPGYFFNLTAGKSLRFRSSFVDELRLVVNYGFLCYQLNQEHQNDAPMYGAKLLLSSGPLTLEGGWHGYSGWLDQGDRPMVLRGKLQYRTGSTHYFLQYQHALRDYPFRRLQMGVCFDLK